MSVGVVKDLRPVVVRGLVSSGVARIVVDSERVAVVTKDAVGSWVHDGQGLRQMGSATNKFEVAVPGTVGLTVVKAGGCTCGKPWLKQGTSQELLSGARDTVTVNV